MWKEGWSKDVKNQMDVKTNSHNKRESRFCKGTAKSQGKDKSKG